jgi:hypothetical protein
MVSCNLGRLSSKKREQRADIITTLCSEAELVRFSKSGKLFAILGYNGIEVYTIVSYQALPQCISLGS